MAPDHEHLHHYLDQFFGWKAGLPIYLAMVAVPIVIGFAGADLGFGGLMLGLLTYLTVWRVTRKRKTTFTGHQSAGSEAS